MDWQAYMADFKNDIRKLNKAAPEATRAFGALSKAVKESGPLDARTKEFIALGIAVATGCTPCIGFHAEVLAREGATREEVADALSMAIQMGGGPALMKAAEALAAFDAFAGER
ncbi:MAG: carboxymuconolactone decarboxylase family protein [Alphaproteobacteria bacterium]|nr:MAG: carboxymuconolactone decarboxylase family protein [Alphaproteobacteria bacterium]